MAKPKKVIATTAYEARDIREVEVHGAFNHGLDRTLKVNDAIESVFDGRKEGVRQKGQGRAGKNGLTDRQFSAAQEYQRAYETQFVGLGESMNFDRVRGPRNPTMSPPERAMAAAKKISDANSLLRWTIDRDAKPGEIKRAEHVIGLIERFAGRGYNIEDCARQVYGIASEARVSGRKRSEIGKAIKDGLDVLADSWFGSPKERMRVFVEERPTGIDPDAFSPGVTAHAGRYRTETAEDVRNKKAERDSRGTP